MYFPGDCLVTGTDQFVGQMDHPRAQKVDKT